MGPANKMFKFTTEIKQTRNDVVCIEDKHYLQKLKIMSMTKTEKATVDKIKVSKSNPYYNNGALFRACPIVLKNQKIQ